jgi:lysyl-tRNA synthetase class 2
MTIYRQTRIMKNLRLRAAIIHAVRQFFIENNYLEIETPCRIPAPAPEEHIEAEASGDWFLQTSPELCMKRLLAAGYSRIFQICKCFRKKERGDKHLPEITLLEWYCTGANYFNLMDQCEDLITYVSRSTGFGNTIVYQGETIDCTLPWPRMPVADAFRKYAPLPMTNAILNEQFDETMALEIEPELGRGKPLFIYDYPASKGALAKLKADNSDLAERFELYIAGIELCNGFTELTDPTEQQKRFEKERSQQRKMGKQSYPLPKRFLESLKDMPPAAGIAFGLDRLVMLFADTTRIDDVVAFTPEEL